MKLTPQLLQFATEAPDVPGYNAAVRALVCY